MPLSTLRLQPRDWRCKTRGQDGSLLLSCETLSFSTPCRFIPAHNEANSTQLAEKKFEKLLKRMMDAPPSQPTKRPEQRGNHPRRLKWNRSPDLFPAAAQKIASPK